MRQTRIQRIMKVGESAWLWRDSKTGIAVIRDGATGLGHSCHANISTTGSVRGMKALGYWAKDSRCVRFGGFVYNIDTYVVSDAYDEVAGQNCMCPACIARRAKEAQSGVSACA